MMKKYAEIVTSIISLVTWISTFLTIQTDTNISDMDFILVNLIHLGQEGALENRDSFGQGYCFFFRKEWLKKDKTL